MSEDLPHRKAIAEARSAPQRAVALTAGEGIVAMAQGAGPQVINALLEIAVSGMSESARVAACNAILDRGHGKPGQSVTVYDGARAMKDAWAVVDVELNPIIDVDPNV